MSPTSATGAIAVKEPTPGRVVSSRTAPRS